MIELNCGHIDNYARDADLQLEYHLRKAGFMDKYYQLKKKDTEKMYQETLIKSTTGLKNASKNMLDYSKLGVK